MLSINRCLFLLTAGFPYGTDEPFLESELPFLADRFDRIFIFAVDAVPGSQATRELPSNAQGFNLARHGKKASRILDFARAVVAPPADAGAYRAEREKAASGFRQRLFLAYFEKRSARVAAECLRVIDGLGLDGLETAVVYSYWLFVTARAGSLVTQALQPRCGALRFYSRAHGYDIYDARNPLGYLPMREYLFGAADAVFPCSNHGTRYLCEKFPSFSAKIRTSYLGTPDFGIGPVNMDGVFHIVSCSRIVPLKRIERILSSLALLKNSGIRLRWTHIGGGKGLESLKQRAASALDFMECCFTGTVPNSAVTGFYAGNPVSLFVNVSSSEGLPVSIMEAASFGIPAVATDVGGTSEIVLDSDTGKLLSPGFSDEDLAKAIADFAAMPASDYASIRARVRAAWQAQFNSAVNYAAFADLLARSEHRQP